MSLRNHLRLHEPIRWTSGSVRQLVERPSSPPDVVVMAVVEPFSHHVDADGEMTVRHSASGLVAAVEPLIRATSGVWIAQGSAPADRRAVELNDGLAVPPDAPRYRLRRVWLDDGEVRHHHDGFAREGLWPLCHRVHVRPAFRADDFETYRDVNRRFADVLQEEARSERPTVLVQDYHLALAPHMIRTRMPASAIATFWHVPWPPAEQFETCPWSLPLIEGLLAADIVGFQTPGDRDNFRATVARVLKDSAARDAETVIHNGHTTEVRAYPTSIEWPTRDDHGPTVELCRRQVREDLRLPLHARMSIGVGTLDYTKGVEEAFLAIERLLERSPEYRGVLTHVQLGAPGRTSSLVHREYGGRVRDAADRINGRFGAAGYRPIVLLGEPYEPIELRRFYRAADLCYVGSLHDGMNLIAKQYVEARDDDRGVLLLSMFAGAAWTLTDAVIVNPYDLDEVASSFARALTMDDAERAQRMRRLRNVVAAETALTWAGHILTDLSRARARREARDPHDVAR